MYGSNGGDAMREISCGEDEQSLCVVASEGRPSALQTLEYGYTPPKNNIRTAIPLRTLLGFWDYFGYSEKTLVKLSR